MPFILYKIYTDGFKKMACQLIFLSLSIKCCFLCYFSLFSLACLQGSLISPQWEGTGCNLKPYWRLSFLWVLGGENLNLPSFNRKQMTLRKAFTPADGCPHQQGALLLASSCLQAAIFLWFSGVILTSCIPSHGSTVPLDQIACSVFRVGMASDHGRV